MPKTVCFSEKADVFISLLIADPGETQTNNETTCILVYRVSESLSLACVNETPQQLPVGATEHTIHV